MFYRTELGDEVGRRLLTNTRDTFYVVRRVATKPFPVGNEFWREAEARNHRFFVIKNGVLNAFLERVHTNAFVINKLESVHIA